MSRAEFSGDDDERANRRPSVADVAKLAGVAVSSVSRVLTDHPDVSPGMRKRVREAARAIGYEPDFLAQSLRRGKLLSVGFVMRDISSVTLAETVLGAETTLRAHGYTMVVLNSGSDPALDARHIRFLGQRRADGLLVSVVDEMDADVVSALDSLAIPAVFVDRDRSGTSASCVLIDNDAAMSAVVAHWSGFGHTAVGLVAAPPSMRAGRDGARAFRAACHAIGVNPHVAHCAAFDPEEAFHAAETLLSAPNRPTAVLSGTSHLLPGVLAAIRKFELHIPQQISLATFDDVPLLDLLEPPIDVVRRFPEEAGAAAAKLLLRRLEGEDPETLLLPVEFVPRGSSGPAS